jgi:hypothetical protein
LGSQFLHDKGKFLQDMSEAGYSRVPVSENYDFLRLELAVLARKTLSITEPEHLVEPTEMTPPSWLSFGQPISFMPIHTDYPDFDTPPRYVLLECLSAGASPVQTVFFDIAKKAFEQRSCGSLLNDPWLIVAGKRRGKIVRILESDRETGDLRIRYAENVMRPFYKAAQSASVLVNLINEAQSTGIILEIGEAVVFDNWRLMHGRNLGLSSSRWKQGSGRELRRIMFV